MKYIVANWKSNKNKDEAKAWFSKLDELLLTRQQYSGYTLVVAVPFPFLSLAQEAIERSQSFKQDSDQVAVPVKLAVQDISPFDAGSYTGAVSARQLANFGVSFAVVGHSERRRYFAETSTEVAAKVALCLEENITPIVCVDDPYLEEQAMEIAAHDRSKILVAYEALATIGTGEPLDPDAFLRAKQEILTAFGSVPVLYGGSVESSNVSEYAEHADGYLVGGASLDPADFVAILDRLQQ